jgi:hypothetical protein
LRAILADNQSILLEYELDENGKSFQENTEHTRASVFRRIPAEQCGVLPKYAILLRMPPRATW